MGPPGHCGCDCEMAKLLWKTDESSKFKQLPHAPEIPPLGIHSEEVKTGFRVIPTFVSSAVLFIADKMRKQPKCPQRMTFIDEQNVVQHLWDYSTRGTITQLEWRETLMYATSWVNPEVLMLSDLGQSQKYRYCMIALL